MMNSKRSNNTNPYYAAPVVDRKGNAVASLVLSILSIPASTIPILGIILGIIGLITGILGIKSSRKAMAIIGIILSTIGILSAFAFWIYNFYLIITGNKDNSLISA